MIPPLSPEQQARAQAIIDEALEADPEFARRWYAECAKQSIPPKPRTKQHPDPNDYRVDELTGCWEWLRAKDAKGYGLTSIKHKTKRAHRVYYEMFSGPIAPGAHIDHLCKNRSCVNPEHLEMVSPEENVRRQSNTKLSHAAAAEIRSLASAYTRTELARAYGVTWQAINNVVKGISWREPVERPYPAAPQAAPIPGTAPAQIPPSDAGHFSFPPAPAAPGTIRAPHEGVGE